MDTKKLLECTTRTELAKLLDLDVKSLTYFAYGTGKKYKTFLIPRKNGGYRQISAPRGALLTIQRKLAKHLSEIYNAPTSVHGFTNDKSIITNAKTHLKKRTILNVDLKDFFPTISDRRIIGLLRSKPFNFNDKIASTITGLVCYQGSLPQGAPTSPILSNMICLRLDNQMTRFCRELHVTYTRYADDITISTNAENLPIEIAKYDDSGEIKLGESFKKIVSDNYFTFNDRKTRISTNTHSKMVTGVKVNSRLNTTSKYMKQIRAMIHAANKYGLGEAQKYFDQNYGGKGRSYERVLEGKLEHLKAVRGYYDMTYRTLYNSYLAIDGIEGVELPVSPDQELLDKILVVRGEGNGTGFILDGQWLITCDHVVGQNDEVEYFTFNNYAEPTRRSVGVNPSWRSGSDIYDLVALEPAMADLRSGFYSFDSASADSVRESETYRVIGFPSYAAGDRPHINPVTVTGIKPVDGILTAYVNTSLIPGYSGSPVLDGSNQVVGIVQTGSPNRRAGEDDYRHTFLPISEMKKCLAQWSE